MEQDINTNKVDNPSNPEECEINELTKEFLTRHWEYYLNFSKITLEEEDNAPRFLLRRLEEIKTTLTYLRFPWEKAIPIIHQGTCLYFERPLGPQERKKLIRLSSQLLGIAGFLAQNKKTIHSLVLYYENQIKDLRAFLGEPENPSEE